MQQRLTLDELLAKGNNLVRSFGASIRYSTTEPLGFILGGNLRWMDDNLKARIVNKQFGNQTKGFWRKIDGKYAVVFDVDSYSVFLNVMNDWHHEQMTAPGDYLTP